MSASAGDPIVEEAAQALERILGLMGLSARVTARDDGERIWLDVAGPDSALVIGKKGATLEALQLLVGKILYRRFRPRRQVIIDTEHYRGRRTQALEQMARELADKARACGQPLAILAMSPADRRVIHLALAEVEGISTRSQGEGALRRMMVIPKEQARSSWTPDGRG